MAMLGLVFWWLHLIGLVSAIGVLLFGLFVIWVAPEGWRSHIAALLLGVAMGFIAGTAHATTEISGGTYSDQLTQGELSNLQENERRQIVNGAMFLAGVCFIAYLVARTR